MQHAYFLVTSRGQCGTRWLARALNSHPQVVCSHGPGALDIALNYERLPTDEERRRNIEGDTARRVGSLSVDDVFAELEAAAPGVAYGNVHMYTLRTLATSLQKHPTRSHFRLVNLVRHPVSWLDSASHNQATVMEISPQLMAQRLKFYSTQRPLCDQLTAPYGVDPTEPSNLAFLGCCLGSLPSFAAEVGTPGVAQVSMERMTTDERFFTALVEGLLGAGIEVSSEWLASVFASGPTNMHAHGAPRAPAERYQAWPAWKRAAFDAVFAQGGGFPHFSALGYDLSFVQGAQRAEMAASAW